MAIPVIDFSKLEGEERAETLAKIAQACEEWGFFQLINHGVPLELLESVKKVCSEWFKLEREEGFKNSKPVNLLNELVQAIKNLNPVKLVNDFVHSEVQGGTSRRLDNVDWEDVFVLTDDIQWPSNPPAFREIMREYMVEIKKLAEKMMEVMDENLGLEIGYIKKAFDGEDCQPFSGTKVSHYPPCPHPELVYGLRPQTDAGGVILLFDDDEVDGLQMFRDGQWMDVPPLTNAIVVYTGDQMQVLSNGRYKSICHRVLTTPYGNRRSVASFYNPSSGATIAPAPPPLEGQYIGGGGHFSLPKGAAMREFGGQVVYP